MKAIMQAYSPEELKRIARGEQTIKVCKTAPKKTPFKVYMYKKPYAGGAQIISEVLNGVYSGGKVVGEYVCENVEKFTVGSLRSDDIEKLGCLSYTELINYFYKPWELDGKTVKQGKALHISVLKIYDTPKKLTDFNKPCVDKYQYCQGCKYGSIILSADEEEYALYHGGRYEYFETVCHNYLSRPPRSWRYVEELEE